MATAGKLDLDLDLILSRAKAGYSDPGDTIALCHRIIQVERELRDKEAKIKLLTTWGLEDNLAEAAKSYARIRPCQMIHPDYHNEVGDWGHLPQEPCRYCRKPGGVYFQINEGQKNLTDPQVVRCSNCGRDWVADSPLA